VARPFSRVRLPPPRMGSTVAESELQPPEGNDWIGVTESPLPVDRALTWASLPRCGGIVTFCGTVRDHSEGRPGVTLLEYEAYLEQVTPRLTKVADEARNRWSEIGRLVLLHRVGKLEVGDVSVVVVTSTPHRSEAFASAEFCIDTLKRTVPIWKHETWVGGSDWSVCGGETTDPNVPRPTVTAASAAHHSHPGGPK
jgi:molybdopterin synthase catalytic subunit